LKKLLVLFSACAGVIIILAPYCVYASCPACEVPTGYEDGIHNLPQLAVEVDMWKDDVMNWPMLAPNEYCCCCFTNNYYSELRPDEPIDGYDCDGVNPDCRIRGNSCVWVTETVALDDLENEDSNGDLSGTSQAVIPWTRLEVACSGGAWVPCPGTTQYQAAIAIFIPDCFDCP